MSRTRNLLAASRTAGSRPRAADDQRRELIGVAPHRLPLAAHSASSAGRAAPASPPRRRWGGARSTRRARPRCSPRAPPRRRRQLPQPRHRGGGRRRWRRRRHLADDAMVLMRWNWRENQTKARGFREKQGDEAKSGAFGEEVYIGAGLAVWNVIWPSLTLFLKIGEFDFFWWTFGGFKLNRSVKIL